jgi:hypothetical protein
VQKLSALKKTLDEQESPIMRTVFAWLFPFGPAWNSILGTFYISSSVICLFHALSELNGVYSVPNFILAFIPAEINPDTLNTMTAFAVSRCASSNSQPIIIPPCTDRWSTFRRLSSFDSSCIHE